MNKNKWFLNGGRGSGRSFRLLCETYENKIADLEKELDYQKQARSIAENAVVDLTKENAELKSEKGCESCTKFDEVQLTKAKELLGYIVKYYREDEDLGLAKEINEAEQFLNSEGK